jgi:hypothetical protein
MQFTFLPWSPQNVITIHHSNRVSHSEKIVNVAAKLSDVISDKITELLEIVLAVCVFGCGPSKRIQYGLRTAFV